MTEVFNTKKVTVSMRLILPFSFIELKRKIQRNMDTTSPNSLPLTTSISDYRNELTITRNTSDLIGATSKIFNESACSINEGSLTGMLAVSYSIIFIIGLIGNMLALYVFLHLNKWNSIQVYLFNVAIADLLLIFCLPFRVMYHIARNKWLLHPVFCKVVGNLFYMNMYISIILLGLISIDRYTKLTCYQQKRASKPKRSVYICCILWAMAIIAVIVMIRTEEHHPYLCFHYQGKQKAKWKASFNYLLVIVFWIVFILLILSYVKIAKNLLSISKKRSHFPNSEKYNITAQKSFIVLFIFTICFVPYHTLRFIYITSQLQNTPCYWKETMHKSNEVMLVLSACNSCLDPLMYFFLSSCVRKTVLHLLYQGHHEDRNESHTSEFARGHAQIDGQNSATPIHAVSFTSSSPSGSIKPFHPPL
ncbi:putative G-protein coupled receptor 34 [Microcaecilia unicolor]|uniref:Probable G-protein coupled receptor 34 n=1 Tax=Microcaecilia unicolor TaxID=1415580 RepID=A0A6P7XYM0_9AMPH|nr:probable G-protein coupled receptor 34 [Microcaecilia unicolor]